MKPLQRKNVCRHSLGEPHKNLWDPRLFVQPFKLPNEKNWHGSELGQYLKYFESPLFIFASTESYNFIFHVQIAFM